MDTFPAFLAVYKSIPQGVLFLYHYFMKRILLYFISWRLLLSIPLVVGYYLVPYRIHSEYTGIWTHILPYGVVDNPAIFPWANFDGVHYLNIAANGYIDNIRFFPLFPILISLLTKPFSAAPYSFVYFFNGFLISNLSFIASLFVFYKLIRLDYNRQIAHKSILFLLVFPCAFFFAAIYTESLFLLLSLLAFYFSRKEKWLFAGICGMLLSATRLVGVFILPALLIEYWLSKEKSPQKLLSLFLIPLGVISFSYFCFIQWGKPLYFIQAAGELSNGRSVNSVVFLPQTLFRYLKILLTVPYTQFEWSIALLELASFIFTSVMLYMAYKKKVRISYIVFGLLCLLLPSLSGTLTGLPRYITIIFPMYITLALLKNKNLQRLYIILSVVLSFILLMLFARGYYIA